MYAKIFWTLSAATLAASALFAVTGTYTPMVGVVLGFWAFGLIFMGMISVLPSTIGHHTPAVPDKAARHPAPAARVEAVAVRAARAAAQPEPPASALPAMPTLIAATASYV